MNSAENVTLYKAEKSLAKKALRSMHNVSGPTNVRPRNAIPTPDRSNGMNIFQEILATKNCSGDALNLTSATEAATDAKVPAGIVRISTEKVLEDLQKMKDEINDCYDKEVLHRSGMGDCLESQENTVLEKKVGSFLDHYLQQKPPTETSPIKFTSTPNIEAFCDEANNVLREVRQARKCLEENLETVYSARRREQIWKSFENPSNSRKYALLNTIENELEKARNEEEIKNKPKAKPIKSKPKFPIKYEIKKKSTVGSSTVPQTPSNHCCCMHAKEKPSYREKEDKKKIIQLSNTDNVVLLSKPKILTHVPYPHSTKHFGGPSNAILEIVKSKELNSKRELVRQKLPSINIKAANSAPRILSPVEIVDESVVSTETASSYRPDVVELPGYNDFEEKPTVLETHKTVEVKPKTRIGDRIINCIEDEILSKLLLHLKITESKDNATSVSVDTSVSSPPPTSTMRMFVDAGISVDRLLTEKLIEDILIDHIFSIIPRKESPRKTSSPINFDLNANLETPECTPVYSSPNDSVDIVDSPIPSPSISEKIDKSCSPIVFKKPVVVDSSPEPIEYPNPIAWPPEPPRTDVVTPEPTPPPSFVSSIVSLQPSTPPVETEVTPPVKEVGVPDDIDYDEMPMQKSVVFVPDSASTQTESTLSSNTTVENSPTPTTTTTNDLISEGEVMPFSLRSLGELSSRGFTSQRIPTSTEPPIYPQHSISSPKKPVKRTRERTVVHKPVKGPVTQALFELYELQSESHPQQSQLRTSYTIPSTNQETTVFTDTALQSLDEISDLDDQ